MKLFIASLLFGSLVFAANTVYFQGGDLKFGGSTSGTVSVKAQAAAGTYNFNLPTTAGTAGQVLTSQGGSSTAMTWTTIDPMLLGNGSNSAPSYSFTNSTNAGMYRVTTDTIGFAAGGILGLEVKKSTGSFANIGMGTSASTSDQFPMIIQRAQNSAGVNLAVENTSTGANSKACIQLKSDNGNNLGDVCTYAASGTAEAITDSMFIRPNGSTGKLALDGGDEATGKIQFFTAGDRTTAGLNVTMNANHTTTFHNHPILQIQGSGSTPTCDAARQGAIALTNGLIMCVCNGSGATWKKVSDGTTTCTF